MEGEITILRNITELIDIRNVCYRPRLLSLSNSLIKKYFVFVLLKVVIFICFISLLMNKRIKLCVQDHIFPQEIVPIPEGADHSISSHWKEVVHEFTSQESTWFNGLDDFQRKHLNIHIKAPFVLWGLETLFWFENNALCVLTKINMFQWIRSTGLAESAYVLDELVNIINLSIEYDQNHHRFHKWLITEAQRDFRTPTIDDVVNFKTNLFNIITTYSNHEILFYKRLTMKKLLKLIVIETRCTIYSNVPFSAYSSLRNLNCPTVYSIQEKS